MSYTTVIPIFFPYRFGISWSDVWPIALGILIGCFIVMSVLDISENGFSESFLVTFNIWLFSPIIDLFSRVKEKIMIRRRMKDPEYKKEIERQKKIYEQQMKEYEEKEKEDK